ncbi:MAG: hypothetical protein OEY24_02205 [Candidatus Bathyarchaeota archaeon]|nr:hypothetical protein [Candidatus Bathyarchaeota archaeon]
MFPYDAVFYLPFAVITLTLTLYFTLIMRLKPSTETKLPTYIKKATQKTQPKKKRKTSKLVESTESSEPLIAHKTEEKECSHYLGYLATLPKGTPFPEECFGCRKVIQCLRIAPTKAIDSFYLTATETE